MRKRKNIPSLSYTRPPLNLPDHQSLFVYIERSGFLRCMVESDKDYAKMERAVLY